MKIDGTFKQIQSEFDEQMRTKESTKKELEKIKIKSLVKGSRCKTYESKRDDGNLKRKLHQDIFQVNKKFL